LSGDCSHIDSSPDRTTRHVWYDKRQELVAAERPAVQEPARVFKISDPRHSEQALPQAAYMSGRVPRATCHCQALCYETVVRRAAGAAGSYSVLVLQTLLRGASEGGAGPERAVRVEGGIHTRRTTGLDLEQHLQEEPEDRVAGWRQAVDHVQSAGNRQ